MASYYYLISSLPELRTDSEMPISYKEFLDMCSTCVSEKKFKFLKELTLLSDEGPVVEDWAVMYRNLMKELNSQRAANLGKQYNSLYDKEYNNSQMVASALSAKNPLEAEKILLDYEFECLDTMVGLHAFDDEYLFGYALKLKLLERQSCFATEKGKKEFKHLFDQVQQRVYNL